MMKSKFDVKIDDKRVDINIIKFSDGTIQVNNPTLKGEAFVKA